MDKKQTFNTAIKSPPVFKTSDTGQASNYILGQSMTAQSDDFEKEPPIYHEKQLLTYAQASRYLAISQVYLRRLKSKKRIPHVPVGTRGVRFKVGSLNAWIEKREVK